MLSPTLLGVIICAAAAVLEGVLAGEGARQRLAQLRMPPYSPPFALWLVIGFLFYAMCFVILRHVLSTGLVSPSEVFALVLTVVLLLANAFWSVLFFRWRDLRAQLHRIRALCGARRRTSHPSRQDLSSRCYLAFVLLHLSYLCYFDGAIIYGDLTPQTPNQTDEANGPVAKQL